MALTYQDMQNRIVRELARFDLTVEIQDSIQSAIHFYRTDPFYQQDATGTISTTQGTQSYAWPSDMVWTRAIFCVANGARYPLRNTTYAELQAENANVDNPVQGQPWDYAIYGSNIYFFPVPDNTYTIEFEYVSAVAPPVTASDTSFWLDDMEPMVRNMAKAVLYAEVLEDDQQATKFAAIAQQFHTKNREASAMKKYSGRVMSWW